MSAQLGVLSSVISKTQFYGEQLKIIKWTGLVAHKEKKKNDFN